VVVDGRGGGAGSQSGSSYVATTVAGFNGLIYLILDHARAATVTALVKLVADDAGGNSCADGQPDFLVPIAFPLGFSIVLGDQTIRGTGPRPRPAPREHDTHFTAVRRSSAVHSEADFTTVRSLNCGADATRLSHRRRASRDAQTSITLLLQLQFKVSFPFGAKFPLQFSFALAAGAG